MRSRTRSALRVFAHMLSSTARRVMWEPGERMLGIRGIHVNWTLPRKLRNLTGTGALMTPDEIVTLIHSAVSWNAFHGPIDMFTDDEGAAWLEDAGLTDLYRQVEVEPLSSLDPRVVDPLIYPTLGNVLVLEFAVCPVAVLDTDFYLMRPAPGVAPGERFVFTHFESVNNFVYPPAACVPDVNAVIDPAWDFSLPAVNMSFAFLGSNRHRAAFVAKALEYASHNNWTSDLYAWVRPCFADQRISLFEATRLGVPARPLVDVMWDPRERSWSSRPPSGVYHHTWHDTDRILSDPPFARRFLERQIASLLRRFPGEQARIRKLRQLGLVE